MPEIKLEKIVLTPDKGFVLDSSKQPVDIMGGLECSSTITREIILHDSEEITAIITRSAQRWTKELEFIPNGYIIHGDAPLGTDPATPPDKRLNELFYSVVVYNQK